MIIDKPLDLITVVTRNRIPFLGKMVKDEVVLSWTFGIKPKVVEARPAKPRGRGSVAINRYFW